MAERRMGIIAFLFCLCLFLTSFCAQAASTADAKEAISPEKECTLTLSYRCNGTSFSDVPVNLYKIADVSADYQYSLASSFVSTGLELNGIQSAGEWNVIRETLEAHIIANRIKENYSAVTDQAGQVSFGSLQPGMSLAVNGEVQNFTFDSALFALPGLDVNGNWQYQIAASPKGKEIPPVNPEEVTELKVLKLWKGDEGKTLRPENIQVEIFRNGKIDQTVTLSEENNWSYVWSVKKDGASWKVVEKDIPSGYVMTVEKRGNTFVLTNSLPSHESGAGDGVEPAVSPQTGDSTSILFYSALMYVSGIVLVLLGITGKRKRT